MNSTYLGARYCWETYRGRPASELAFKVTWIGFWFNIPGVTLDPTKVANDFINEGYDVILSGIDTTEAIVEANKATQAGKRVFAVPYDFKGACAQGEAVVWECRTLTGGLIISGWWSWPAQASGSRHGNGRDRTGATSMIPIQA